MDNEGLKQYLQSLLDLRDTRRIRELLLRLPVADIPELLEDASPQDLAIVLRILPKEFGTRLFQYLDMGIQKGLVKQIGERRFALILNEMEADDRTSLLQEFDPEIRERLIASLDIEERARARSLLEYPDHSIGRLMSPDYIAVGPTWTVKRALDHIRENAQDLDTSNLIYVVDDSGKLIDDLLLSEILVAPLDRQIVELMNWKYIALEANRDQEVAVEMFSKYDRSALPVVDEQRILVGVVTVDDVLDVAAEETTEDIQKLGGTEALDQPYMETPLLRLFKKRAVWLVVLFLGEMLTATAMGFFEMEIEKAVVLALFIPLIISSGGNSGSQAATLIIRALALGEIGTSDWKRVFRRELASGVMLGLSLGIVGFVRVAVWSLAIGTYGPHWPVIGLVLVLSVAAVVTLGTLTGSMLPLLLTRLKIDPATSSAPFVATIVDVMGLVLYFSIAAVLLKGLLL